jgi:hypothetical protein
LSVKSHIELLRNFMKIMNFVCGIFCFVIVTCFALEGAEKITKKPEYKVDGIPMTVDKMCLACFEGDMERVNHLWIWENNASINYLNTLSILKCESSFVDIHVCGKGKYTPLMCAIKANQTHIVKALLKDADKLSLDINKKNEQGITALHYAVINGCLEHVTLLLEHKAEVNEKNNIGFTPLHYTVWAGVHNKVDTRIIQGLIKYGADMRIKNNEGLTPLFYATTYHFREDAEELTPGMLSTLEVLAPSAARCLLELGAPINEMRTGYPHLHLLKINPQVACQTWALSLFQQGEMSKKETPKKERSLVTSCFGVLEKNGQIKDIFGVKVNDDVRHRYARFQAEQKTVSEFITFLKQVFNTGIEPSVQENFIKAYAREEPKICLDERVACYYYGFELNAMSKQQKEVVKIDFLTKRENHIYGRVSGAMQIAAIQNKQLL